MPVLLAFAAAFVLSVVLLATGNTIVPPHVWSAIWNMPPGMGALLGSFFGLLGVAGSALIAFQALMKSREREAEIARDLDDRLRSRERRALAAALRGELRAVRGRVASAPYWLASMRKQIEGVDGQSKIEMVGSSIVTLSTPIFEARVQDLGLLPVTTVAAVATVFDRLHFWAKHVQIDGMNAANLKDRFDNIEKTYGPLIERIDILEAALHELALRGEKPPPD